MILRLNVDDSKKDIKYNDQAIGWTAENLAPKTSEIMAISFIKMFKAGPEVSLRGSPTVSPTTAALCTSDPFL